MSRERTSTHMEEATYFHVHRRIYYHPGSVTSEAGRFNGYWLLLKRNGRKLNVWAFKVSFEFAVSRTLECSKKYF